MAAVPPWNAALSRIGLSAATIAVLTDTARENLTLQTLADYDDKQITELVKRLAKPGGVIPNPRATARGQPATIPDPGTYVSGIAADRLKVATFIARHYRKTGRTMTPAIK